MASDVVTWARLRSPIGNEYTAYTGGKTQCNIVYAGEVFVSADCNSPLRTYYTPYDIGTTFHMFFTLNNIFGGVFVEWHAYGAGAKTLPDEQIDQLVGETVTYVGGTPGTFTMTINAWEAGGQSTGASGPITDIGKLVIV